MTAAVLKVSSPAPPVSSVYLLHAALPYHLFLRLGLHWPFIFHSSVPFSEQMNESESKLSSTYMRLTIMGSIQIIRLN